MSVKRRPSTELSRERCNEEDSTEREDMGTFKTAPKEVLEKRVFRTVKRRCQVSGEEPKKVGSVFSGFGGFNSVPKSSFDFLANLTNGSKANNVQSTTKTDTAVSSSIFTNKSLSSNSSTGIFSTSVSSGFTTKPTLGKSPEGSVFGSAVTNPIQSIFTASKADSTVSDSPFKLQSTPATDQVSKPSANPDTSTSQVSSTIFGTPSNSSANKSLFSSTTSNSALFSTQAVSSTSTSSINSATTTKPDTNTAKCETTTNKIDEKKLTYYSKLRGLNESVSDWIKKHVEETPLCILSPIFQDYERYLREIQHEYNGGETGPKKVENKTEPKAQTETKNPPVSSNVNVSAYVVGNLTPSNVGKPEAPQNNTTTISFGFAIDTPATTTANTGFSFGINPSTPNNASKLFSITTTTSSTGANANTPFSFGINKSGFGFNATSPPKTETSEVPKDEDDEPPKVEFTPVVEENSVFDTKCKIFIKKDGNFVDKGVGTLYIKKIEESGKHQLLVRANTNLGSVLLNFILSTSVPTQRMGKNNVMLVCIPTPDAKPPPTPILIRVKTEGDADELLSTLEKYKA